MIEKARTVAIFTTLFAIGLVAVAGLRWFPFALDARITALENAAPCGHEIATDDERLEQFDAASESGVR